MNPQEFARDHAPTETAPNGETAGEFGAPGSGSGPTGPVSESPVDRLLSALMSTDGGAPLESIQREYECGLPVAYIVRGLLKASSVSGFPALVDLAAGVVLLSVGAPAAGPSDDRQGGQERQERQERQETAGESWGFVDEPRVPPGQQGAS